MELSKPQFRLTTNTQSTNCHTNEKKAAAKCLLVVWKELERHSGQTVQLPQMNFNLLFIQCSQSVVTFTDRNYPACTPQAEPQTYSDCSVQIYVVGKWTELVVSSTPAHKVSVVRGGRLTTKGGRGGELCKNDCSALTPQFEPQRYPDWLGHIYNVGKLTELIVFSTLKSIGLIIPELGQYSTDTILS